MDYKTIIQKAESFVRTLFDKNQGNNLLFHNIEHTENVVARAKEIAAQYDIPEKDQAVLYIGAWFHDTGHLFVEPAMHEVKSIEIMKTFMKNLAGSEGDDLVVAVEKCILATRLPSNPKSLPEQIICDADTYHIGTKEFKKTDKQLRKEFLKRKLISPTANWNKRSLEFLEGHQFHKLYKRPTCSTRGFKRCSD
jgi:HD superfamily phosphodiesterase